MMIKPGQAYLEDERVNPDPDFDRLDGQSILNTYQISAELGRPTTVTSSGEVPDERVSEAPVIGAAALICGDCITPVGRGESCGHLKVDADGHPHILG